MANDIRLRLKRLFGVLFRPLVYVAGALFAAWYCYRWEPCSLTDDSENVRVSFIGMSSEPVLLFRTNRYVFLFLGIDADQTTRHEILLRHWTRYYDTRVPEPVYQDDNERPEFGEVFRSIVFHDRIEAELRIQRDCRADERAAQVKLWLDAGSNVNAIADHLCFAERCPHLESTGWSLLMLSAMFDEPAISRLMLEQRADITLRDSCGQTALAMAASGHPAVVELLLAYRAASVTDDEIEDALGRAHPDDERIRGYADNDRMIAILKKVRESRSVDARRIKSGHR